MVQILFMDLSTRTGILLYRKLNAYFFFTCGDLLDAPEWDDRMKKNEVKNTQHDSGHFDIALELARYIVE